jgi:hypothetical protein
MAKRKTIRALFEDVENLSVEQIQKSEALKDLLKIQVPVAILEASQGKKQLATVFEINSTDHYIEIPKKDWVQSLETCIMWYLETEDYEKCSKLRDIIEDLQKKPVKKISIKTDNNDKQL